MSVVYFLAYHFPFWGLPLAYILFEMSNHYRRRGKTLKSLVTAFLSVFFFVCFILFFFYSGFDTIVPFIKSLERQYL